MPVRFEDAEDRQIARERQDAREERKGVRYEDEPPMSEAEYERYWAEIYRGGYEGYDE